MTPEEKAKRYDELLLKLQKAKVDDNVCDEMYYRVIDDIVPELKESEDEKIRKELIGFLRNIPNTNYTCEEMALWLEKQGEQKPQGKTALEAIKEEKVDNADKDEIEIPFGAKDSELQEDTYYIPKGFHAEIDEDKVAIKKGELNIRKLESLVKQIWATAEHENDKDTIHKMSDLSFFLKTLKPQLKQEWSEEDEYCRHQLIVFCENCMVQDDGAKRCAHWLKSIKDRFTWRASDEQMIALNDVITNGHLSNANERILKGLQDQLKKLK